MELGDRLVTVEVPQNGCAAIERSARWVYGRLVSPVPPLVIHGVTGEISVTVGGKQEAFSRSRCSRLTATAERWPRKRLPCGRATTGRRRKRSRLRDRFAKILVPGRPALTQIVDAVEESNADTKQLAIERSNRWARCRI